MNTDVGLLRLLQLCSATLPVGAYAFSQGLEHAIDQQWIADENTAREWLFLSMSESLAKTDAPVLYRLISAQQEGDGVAMIEWNDCLLACRETHELRLTDVAMGGALKRLLSQMDMERAFDPFDEPSFATGFAIATVHWRIDCESAMNGYLWSWLESQVAALTKLLPMGQTRAQQMLFELAEKIPQITKSAQTISDRQIGASLPGLAMASAWHETQYSRLYRS
jgi:urease accessory protein